MKGVKTMDKPITIAAGSWMIPKDCKHDFTYVKVPQQLTVKIIYGSCPKEGE